MYQNHFRNFLDVAISPVEQFVYSPWFHVLLAGLGVTVIVVIALAIYFVIKKNRTK